MVGPSRGLPPDPGTARTIRELIDRLHELKAWLGGPEATLSSITDRVNRARVAAVKAQAERVTPAMVHSVPSKADLVSRSAVGNLFNVKRRRLDEDLLCDVVAALCDDAIYQNAWRKKLRILYGEAAAGTYVEAQSSLPSDSSEFVGRDEQLGRMADFFAEGVRQHKATVIVIEGMAGVGKTKLAIQAVARLRSARPFEHLLFVNLRGFHDDQHRPLADTSAVLGNFLGLLGHPPQQLPFDARSRSMLYRKLLRRKRALVVLDNAASVEQVHLLLPGNPNSVTIITSRRTLTGLADAYSLDLSTFTAAESRDLLERVVGPERIAADIGSAAGIADECGHLPLALSFVARLILATDWTLEDHHQRLVEQRILLKVDEPVQVALSASYQHLSESDRWLLRLLSMHPGPDIDDTAASTLAAADPRLVRAGLQRLAQWSVLSEPRSGRYELHDLVRTFANARAVDVEPASGRRDARNRLVDHYLRTAGHAMDILFPLERHMRPRLSLPGLVGFEEHETSARAWMDIERSNILAVASTVDATDAASRQRVLAFSAILHRQLVTGAHYPEAVALHVRALAVADFIHDDAARAAAMANLGNIYRLTGDYDQARYNYEQAILLCQSTGNLLWEGIASNGLGIVHATRSENEDAAHYLNNAVRLLHDVGDRNGEVVAGANLATLLEQTGQYALAREAQIHNAAAFAALGNSAGQAQALYNQAVAAWRLGHHEEAADCARDALNTFSDLDDRHWQALSYDILGILAKEAGDFRLATDYYQQSLLMYQAIGNPNGEAAALTHLGAIFQLTGDFSRATEHQHRSLTIAEALGDPIVQSEALSGLGSAALAAGQYLTAIDHFERSLDRARAANHPFSQAEALGGLGDTYHHMGDSTNAAQFWERALAKYDELGVPEAAGIRTKIANLTLGQAGTKTPKATRIRSGP